MEIKNLVSLKVLEDRYLKDGETLEQQIDRISTAVSSVEKDKDYWKDKFSKLISFLHDKLHSWYDKDDKYIGVVNDMYEDNVLDDDDIEELNLNKEKDDFER